MQHTEPEKLLFTVFDRAGNAGVASIGDIDALSEKVYAPPDTNTNPPTGSATGSACALKLILTHPLPQGGTAPDFSKETRAALKKIENALASAKLPQPQFDASSTFTYSNSVVLTTGPNAPISTDPRTGNTIYDASNGIHTLNMIRLFGYKARQSMKDVMGNPVPVDAIPVVFVDQFRSNRDICALAFAMEGFIIVQTDEYMSQSFCRFFQNSKADNSDEFSGDIAHELGHLFGLDHQLEDVTAIMANTAANKKKYHSQHATHFLARLCGYDIDLKYTPPVTLATGVQPYRAKGASICGDGLVRIETTQNILESCEAHDFGSKGCPTTPGSPGATNPPSRSSVHRCPYPPGFIGPEKDNCACVSSVGGGGTPTPAPPTPPFGGGGSTIPITPATPTRGPITPRCGDGQVEVGVEQCDDGNTKSGDGCTDKCINEFCGDTIVNNNNPKTPQADEECDPPFTGYCPDKGLCMPDCLCVSLE